MALKHVKYCLLLLIYTLNASGQYLIEDTEKERVAKNNIKVKTEWEHSYSDGKVDANGTKISVTKFDNNGNILSKLSYRFNGDTSTYENSKYDPKGNQVEFSKYDGKRKMYTVKTYTKYDPKGNKVNERGQQGNAGDYSTYYKYNSNGELSEIYYYSNNELTEKRVISNAGNIREIIIYNGSNQQTGKISKTYDSKDNLLQETTYGADGSLKKDFKYKYDSKGRAIEEEQNSYGRLNIKKTFTYDNSDNLIKIVYEKPGSNAFTNNIYTYDTRGLLVQEQWFNESKNKYSFKKYKYSSSGNLIEANCYFAQFNSQYVYKYQYENY